MCLGLIDLACWYAEVTGIPVKVTRHGLDKVSESLCLSHREDLPGMRETVLESLVGFERSLQARLRGDGPDLSLQGAPVGYLANELMETDQFGDKLLFFLFDEFENLEPYQQQVVNTLIKHCGATYSIKLGMRPYGWKSRLTITGETLMEPADYSIVPIGKAGPEFEELAERICNDRLQAVRSEGIQVGRDVREILPGLSLEEEFNLLGGRQLTASIRHDYLNKGLSEIEMTDWELYTVHLFRESDETAKNVAEIAAFDRDGAKLAQKMNNYGYAALFTIRRGRTGTRKYYGGWDTLLKLAGGNLRFLLWLVHECLIRQLRGNHKLEDGVSPSIQTEAAIDVAERVLKELPDESQQAGKLIYLVLGLGRIFQVLAASPRGHLPEATQFSRKLGPARQADVSAALEDGVRHLALVEYQATKMQVLSVKENDFALHPVFSPFFCYSHRRKRKLALSDAELAGLMRNPGEHVGVLKRLKADVSVEMPQQMSLYEEVYENVQ
jgi:hypothetical protein